MKKIEERLQRIKNHFEAFHRTRWENVQSIIDNGFRPGFGEMYGRGWYFTYDLDSQTKSSMVHYGDALLKCKINPKNLLIFDYNVSKDLWGDKYSLVDQLIDHYKIYPTARAIPSDLFFMSKELEKTFSDPLFSADIAYNQFVRKFIKNGKPTIKEVYGIVFTGNHDGNVLVSYAYDTAVPVEVAVTDPSTGQISQNFTKVDNLKAVDRAQKAELALEFFKGRVLRLEIQNFPLDKIETEFKWLKNADFNEAEIEIEDDGSLIWYNGTWKRGTWESGTWLGGTWVSGKWLDGTFSNGTWEFGNFMGGRFGSNLTNSYPVWKDGTWTDGEWVEGVWNTGEIMVRKRPVKSAQNPRDFSLYGESTGAITMDNRLAEALFLDESFKYYDLTPQEQDELYQQFQQSYQQATGASFSTGEFTSRAGAWLFFGETEGGIAVRPQRSGLYKLVATWGATRKIFNAFQEMNKEIGNKPIWGAMTDNLAKMLEKISRGDFKQPPAMFVKAMVPHMKSVFGDAVHGVEKDGGIKIDTPAGIMKKFFVGNRSYYQWILGQIDTNDRIPKIAKGPLKLALRKLAK